MAARAGLLSRASYRVPVAVLLAVRLQRARHQILFGRPQIVSNHITPSMAGKLGTPSLFREFPAGAGLTLHTTSMRERLPRTVCCRIRSICIMLVRGYSKPRMAEARGQKNLADKSHPAPTSMQNSNLFLAKPAISSLPEGVRAVLNRSPKAFSDQSMAEQHGQLFPTSLKSVVSVSARLRQVRATHQSTSSDT